MPASPSLAENFGTRPDARVADDAYVAPAWLIGLALALWVVLLRAPFLGAELTDDAFYIRVGDLWRHGHLPYVAIFDVKPPGYFLLARLSEARSARRLERYAPSICFSTSRRRSASIG